MVPDDAPTLLQRHINTFYLATTNNQKCLRWFFLH